MSLKTLKVYQHTSSGKVTPPKPKQTASPAGDQVFRSLRLWGASHPNHKYVEKKVDT